MCKISNTLVPGNMSLLRAISTSFLAICAPTGIISNILVLIVFNRQEHNNYSYIFFMHLACVDLMLCTGALVTGLGVSHNGGFFFCKGGLLIIALFYCLSSGTLCLMTYDRFIYISMPLRYYCKMTPRRAKTLLVFVWTISVINVLPVLTNTAFNRSKGPFYELDIKNCVLPKIINIPYFFWLEAVFLTFLVVTIVYNFRIMSFARKQSRKVEAAILPHNHLQATSGNNESILSLSTLQQKNNHRDSYRTLPGKGSVVTLRGNTTRKFAKFLKHVRQRKYIKVIGCIIIVHCICNLPYFGLITAEILHGYLDYKKIKYLYSLYLLNYLNSVLNPFIYISLNSSLRRSAKKLLCSFIRRT